MNWYGCKKKLEITKDNYNQKPNCKDRKYNGQQKKNLKTKYYTEN